MSDIIKASPLTVQRILAVGKDLESIDKRDGYIALYDRAGKLVNQNTPLEFIRLIVILDAADPLPEKALPTLPQVLEALSIKGEQSTPNSEGDVAVYDPAGILVSKTAFEVFRQVVANLYDTN